MLAYVVPQLRLESKETGGGELPAKDGPADSQSRKPREKTPEKTPSPFLPPYVRYWTPSPPLPPNSPLHRSAYVVTNDTFIFLQRLCVCKTAEVHQDVKYFGRATQVALEDNQMEV